MGVRRALGLESNEYHATRPVREGGDPIELRAGELRESGRGILLVVTPNPDNNGPVSMASVYESMYSPVTQPVQSFEMWFHEGEVRFFILADSEREADDIRQTVTDNYPNSIVETVDPTAEGFPTIGPGDYCSAAWVQKHHPAEVHEYLPIAYYDDKHGWPPEQMPIAEITSAMKLSSEASVVVQAVMKPLPSSWTDSSMPLFNIDKSAGQVAQEYRDEGRSDYARMVDDQTSQSPFAVNLRILAISPDAATASNRAATVAGKFDRKFTSKGCGMGLMPHPVSARTDWGQRRKTRSFVKKMHRRAHHTPTDTVLGNEEATCLQIPQEEAGASGINWKKSRTGSDAPINRPEHTVPDSLEDIDPDRLPSIGGGYQQKQAQEHD